MRQGCQAVSWAEPRGLCAVLPNEDLDKVGGIYILFLHRVEVPRYDARLRWGGGTWSDPASATSAIQFVVRVSLTNDGAAGSTPVFHRRDK